MRNYDHLPVEDSAAVDESGCVGAPSRYPALVCICRHVLSDFCIKDGESRQPHARQERGVDVSSPWVTEK